MSYLDLASGSVVSELPAEQRAAFIRRTYSHLALAIGAFAIIESYLLSLGWGEKAMAMLATSKWSWLFVLAGFMFVGVIADKWARSDHSKELQYAGLGLYVVAQAVMFLPLLYMAQRVAPGTIQNAAIITGSLVAALSFVAFTTRKDFSFLAPAIKMGFFIAIGVIIASIVFGTQLGMFFSAAMIIFSALCVLYSTSNIIHVYREDQHVAASLSLFASVALMFWYVVQFLMSFTQE